MPHVIQTVESHEESNLKPVLNRRLVKRACGVTNGTVTGSSRSSSVISDIEFVCYRRPYTSSFLNAQQVVGFRNGWLP